MKTPHTSIRIPIWIKKAVNERTNNLSKYMIEATMERINKETPNKEL